MVKIVTMPGHQRKIIRRQVRNGSLPLRFYGTKGKYTIGTLRGPSLIVLHRNVDTERMTSICQRKYHQQATRIILPTDKPAKPKKITVRRELVEV